MKNSYNCSALAMSLPHASKQVIFKAIFDVGLIIAVFIFFPNIVGLFYKGARPLRPTPLSVLQTNCRKCCKSTALRADTEPRAAGKPDRCGPKDRCSATKEPRQLPERLIRHRLRHPCGHQRTASWWERGDSAKTRETDALQEPDSRADRWLGHDHHCAL